MSQRRVGPDRFVLDVRAAHDVGELTYMLVGGVDAEDNYQALIDLVLAIDAEIADHEFTRRLLDALQLSQLDQEDTIR